MNLTDGTTSTASYTDVFALRVTQAHLVRAAVVTLLCAAFATLFWFKPSAKWPGILDLNVWINSTLNGWGVGYWWRYAVRSFLFVGIAIGVLWALGHPPAVLGLGRMAQQGWRITATGFVLALPFLVVTGLDPAMHHYYRNVFQPGGWQEVVASGLVMFAEHAYIEGVVLAMALPAGHFSALGVDPPRRGKLSWLGFGNTEEGAGLLDWLGVPAVAMPALVGQALVFFMVHIGKAPVEVATSLPGGFFAGLITYRVRSVWPGAVLHIGTGWVILMVIALAR